MSQRKEGGTPPRSPREAALRCAEMCKEVARRRDLINRKGVGFEAADDCVTQIEAWALTLPEASLSETAAKPVAWRWRMKGGKPEWVLGGHKPDNLPDGLVWEVEELYVLR